MQAKINHLARTLFLSQQQFLMCDMHSFLYSGLDNVRWSHFTVIRVMKDNVHPLLTTNTESKPWNKLAKL